MSTELSKIIKPVQVENSEILELVREFFNPEHNLEGKTELSNPTIWTLLTTIIDRLEDCKLPKSAQILAQFKENQFRHLISKDRKGRLEAKDIIDGLGSMIRDKQIHNNKPGILQ